MKYTIIDLERDIENITQELAEMRAAKGHDYSGTEDTLDNLREFGSFGILVRLMDKMKRLKHFYLGDGILKVQDEKIEDTIKDSINYSNYLLILYRQEREAEKCAEKKGLVSEPVKKANCLPTIEEVTHKACVRSYEEIVKEEENKKNE